MIIGTGSDKSVEEMAGEWLARRDSDHWSESDQIGLERWLNGSPLHQVAFLRLEHVWERSRRLKVLGHGARPGKAHPSWRWTSRSEDSHRGHGKRLRAFAFAATFLLGVVSGGVAWYRWPQSGSSYRTPVGGIASIPISDGSRMTLNTDSEVRVAVSRKERRVDLKQGEVFFEVAKDPTRPFVVSVGSKRITVLGTQFAVRRDPHEIRIAVTEGGIRIEAEGKTPMDATAKLLTSGTVARVSDTGILLQHESLAELDEALGWRSGIIVFHDMTLSDAVAELNRYSTHKIVIEGQTVAELRVAGRFRLSNADALVRLLERGYPLQAEYRNDQIILRGR
jgi:transmembrane sensor